MGRPAETSLLTVLGTGENKVLTLLKVISDLVVGIISNSEHSKDFGDTLGAVPNSSIPRWVSNLIDGHVSIIASEV